MGDWVFLLLVIVVIILFITYLRADALILVLLFCAAGVTVGCW